MDEEQQSGAHNASAVTVRTMEIVVAVVIFVLGRSSSSTATGWARNGALTVPQSGYFPFYIGILICFSSLGTLAQAFMKKDAARETLRGLGTVEARVYGAVSGFGLRAFAFSTIGIYVASAIYIAIFMVWLGKYSWIKSAVISVAVNVISS